MASDSQKRNSKSIDEITEELEKSLGRQQDAIAKLEATASMRATADVIKAMDREQKTVNDAVSRALRMRKQSEPKDPRSVYRSSPKVFPPVHGPTMDEVLSKNTDRMEEWYKSMISALDQQTNAITELIDQARFDSERSGIEFETTTTLSRRGLKQNWAIMALTIVVPVAIWYLSEARKPDELSQSIQELSGAVSELNEAVANGGGQISNVGHSQADTGAESSVAVSSEVSSGSAQPQPAPTPARAPADNAESSSGQREP